MDNKFLQYTNAQQNTYAGGLGGLAAQLGVGGHEHLYGTATYAAHPVTSTLVSTTSTTLPTVKEKTMLQEVASDIKGFIREHRGMLYFIIIALLVDHFVFAGAFKERLKALCENIVGKVEQKVKDATL